MNKEELIKLIDILDESEIHVFAGGKILAFVDFINLEEFTKILGICGDSPVDCILRDGCVIVDLIKIEILDCEEIELIENRYKK